MSSILIIIFWFGHKAWILQLLPLSYDLEKTHSQEP